MGLGSIKDVSLSEARDAARAARKMVRAGADPIAARRIEVSIPTFGKMADELVETLATSWKNPKHKAAWTLALTTYAAPLREMSVDEVSTADVLRVLKPIWTTRAETAARLRGRIEHVLDAAKAAGHRSGDNPAAWKGNLKSLLPARQKLTRGHHPALPYTEISDFMVTVRERDAVAARALEWTILTATRTGEALGAAWGEIDRETKVWTVPASRTKAGIEHRVPLGPRLLEILDELEALKTGAFVFPGSTGRTQLSAMSMSMLLRRLGRADITVHGFRSTFRDWCGEATAFPREIAEQALAHAVGDAVERAYRRGDALERRRGLMEAWERYCAGDRTVVELAMTA
jgi:integrase